MTSGLLLGSLVAIPAGNPSEFRGAAGPKLPRNSGSCGGIEQGNFFLLCVQGVCRVTCLHFLSLPPPPLVSRSS